MYQSAKARLRESELAALNDLTIGREVQQLIRNQLLMQGITPIEMETLNPNIQRDTAMELLKNFTYTPKAVYNYLFNLQDGISNFIKYNEDFKKMVRGLTNMSLEEFRDEWQYFTDVEMKKEAFKNRARFTKPKERKTYELDEQKRKEVQKLEEEETSKRTAIAKYQGEARSRTINTPFKKEKELIIKRLNDAAREEYIKAQQEEYANKQQEFFNKYGKLIQLRDLIKKEEDAKGLDKLIKIAKEELDIKGSGKRSNIKESRKRLNKVKIIRFDWM